MRKSVLMVNTTDAEFEALARFELRKFHIDDTLYTRHVVARNHAHKPLVVLDGISHEADFPQAWVYFTELGNRWSLRVDLFYGQHRISVAA